MLNKRPISSIVDFIELCKFSRSFLIFDAWLIWLILSRSFFQEKRSTAKSWSPTPLKIESSGFTSNVKSFSQYKRSRHFFHFKVIIYFFKENSSRHNFCFISASYTFIILHFIKNDRSHKLIRWLIAGAKSNPYEPD